MELTKFDFSYNLPPELIAQTPAPDRQNSRMLVIDRRTGALEDRIFSDITDFIEPGDCVVFNDTKVFPARLLGKNEQSGGAMEFLLLSPLGGDRWEVLAKPGRRAVAKKRYLFGDSLSAEVEGVLENGNRTVKFFYDKSADFMELLQQTGSIPLPHYIHAELKDPDRYQTVYSANSGSVAAPTAGLHFTQDIIKALEQKGVLTAYLTLHVGVGTFRPVSAENVSDHKMHSEIYNLPADAVEKITRAKAANKRVFCVGTTSCRTLESVYRDKGRLTACHGSTDIFIYPPYDFKVIDCLITNFHLPESTLIMLVSAFCGRENTLTAYAHAVKERYRFFSFGDCCLIK